MSNIVLVRLDSRLAHGTVCVGWAPALNMERILVIHDIHCKNEMIKRIQRMAAPQNVSLDTISSDAVASMYQDGSMEEVRTFVIIGDIATAFKCYEKGFAYSELQLANITPPPGAKTKTIAPGINVNDDDVEKLKKLQEKGVYIYFQNQPTQSRKPLDEILKAAKF